VGLLIELNQT